jgi:ABC-2 type transport system ATP-binding protein
MPDLLDSPDSGRGSRTLNSELGTLPNAECGMRNVELKTTIVADVPHSAFRTPHSALGVPLLLCERVSKWYGPVIGVNQVTLELRPGITGLVGSNGAGKSTLMRLITGHLRPDVGQIEIRGLEAWTAAAKRHVGYCPEIDVFYEEMSGRQFVETMARLFGYTKGEARRRTGDVLDLVGMTNGADRKVRGYSKGMRQRVKLAQALLHEPELLVLDEPMSGIDPVGRAEFVELFKTLAQRGKCLLISSHELDELEKLTDHVAIMSHGRIAAVGTLAQIRARLDRHPMSIRIEISLPPQQPDKSAQDVGREFATALLRLPDVIGVELSEEVRPEEGVSRVLVRARNPQRFFKDLGRLVMEEWFEVVRLETLDDSAEAVLSYLLGS